MRTLEEIESRIVMINAEISTYEITKSIAINTSDFDKEEACNSLIDKANKAKSELEWVLGYGVNR